LPSFWAGDILRPAPFQLQGQAEAALETQRARILEKTAHALQRPGIGHNMADGVLPQPMR